MKTEILHGDCLDLLPTLPDNSVDSIVTDPPYHLTELPHLRQGNIPAGGFNNPRTAQGKLARAGFMGKNWDGGDISFRPDVWLECYRVLKPGGHIAVFGGSRTHHRIWCAVEDAGFEIRDTIMWITSQGFPKSLNVSKAIDKHLGYEREVVGASPRHGGGVAFAEGHGGFNTEVGSITAPASPEAKHWDGWGTAIKPAHEPILLARKPLSEKTVAQNVLKWGTGAINIDACRVEAGDEYTYPEISGGKRTVESGFAQSGVPAFHNGTDGGRAASHALGRWPANVCYDGSDEVLEAFFQFGERRSAYPGRQDLADAYQGSEVITGSFGGSRSGPCQSDSGTAARFFYCAKASKADRAGSKHPTVKPIKLMEWLIRLVTPLNGMVLDPFAGSGTTGEAALAGGYDATLIEREDEYIADIKRRFSL